VYSILTYYSHGSDGVIQTTVEIVRIVGFIYSVVNLIIFYYFNWPIDDECDFQNCLPSADAQKLIMRLKMLP